MNSGSTESAARASKLMYSVGPETSVSKVVHRNIGSASVGRCQADDRVALEHQRSAVRLTKAACDWKAGITGQRSFSRRKSRHSAEKILSFRYQDHGRIFGDTGRGPVADPWPRYPPTLQIVRIIAGVGDCRSMIVNLRAPLWPTAPHPWSVSGVP